MPIVCASGQLVINEILVSNQNGLLDEDGEPQDWIEIINRGPEIVNLSNWSLSDDADHPEQWMFPSRTLAPGEYLVVFASGKDRKTPTGTNRFHTNFKLSGSGEFLGLYSPGQPRVLVSGFSPNYPEQRNDNSFGFDPGGNLRYFAAPTPSAPNGESTITGVAEPVHCSVNRGHFTQPFDLILSCPTPAVIIRYTLDGSEPTASSGLPYFQPLRVTNTTLFRAAAFRADLLPSRSQTHSYLFNLTPAQLSLPILSIVTAPNHLFGRTGILGMGGGSRQGSDQLFITNNPATDYHNPSAHGIAWERPVSLELIQPGDNSGFQINCGLRVQGSDYHRPRLLPTDKFSFRAYFRGDYGPGRLDYPLFPGTTVRTFDRLVLRGGGNERTNPFVRDEFARRLSQDMGQVASHGLLVNVFTNGGFAGYYNPVENIDAPMFQSHLGGSEDWDVVSPTFNFSSEGYGIVDGDRTNFTSLVSYINTQPVSNMAEYQEITRRLDVVNFVDYLLLNVYAAMGDWPANNFRAGRDRGPDGIWRFIVWDAEIGFNALGRGWLIDTFADNGLGLPNSGLASPNSEIAQIYQSLRPNREFRLLWADRIHKHFFNGGALTEANGLRQFQDLRDQMSSHFEMDNFITNYNSRRFAALAPMFNTYGLYGFSNALYGIFASSNTPAFNQHGGAVAPGFSLTMSAPLPGSVIYYSTNGDDPRVMFTGAVSNSAVAYSGIIALNQSMRIRARALWQGTNWSALNEADFKVAALGVPLRLTELNYNPTNPAHEFLEIQNVGGSAVDLSGMTFEGVTYTFGVGASLAPGARLVLVSDFGPAEFAARYPGVAVFGYYSGNLNNGGERIALKDRNGKYIFTVDYDDAGGWPTAPDGGGTSLEITDVFGDPDDPANWHASTAPGGSPGGANSSVPAPVVRLSEVLAENGGVVNHSGTFPDYVEIQNTGGSPVNLAGWSLTDDGNARKFVFPSTSIPAGGYVTVWCDDATNTSPGLHTGFALQRGGDTVQLFNASTNLADALTFGLQLTNHSVGRVGGEWVLNTPTPGADNAAAALASASTLVINEWQASVPPGQSDWIELHNTAAQPVALRGCYLSITTAVHRITSLSFVPAFGFAQLFADEGVGPDHLDFRLNAAGSTIVLHDPVAAEVNRVTYTNAVEGLTRGRLPDGAASIVNFPGSASPGASNYVNTYTGAVINEVLARNRSAVTNAGNAADYIELFNPTGTPFSLLGMSLSVNSAEPGQYVFLATATVPANGHLVIWCDASRPASFGPADLQHRPFARRRERRHLFVQFPRPGCEHRRIRLPGH
ncbi:MAG: lamin tail domain-containing protein [Verrucomicrobia bacterium]|nr:lamin tail domain-containing protein [Verrucomicrobiota bacterium]